MIGEDVGRLPDRDWGYLVFSVWSLMIPTGCLLQRKATEPLEMGHSSSITVRFRCFGFWLY